MKLKKELQIGDLVYCKNIDEITKYVAIISHISGDKHKSFKSLKNFDGVLENDIDSKGIKNDILSLFNSFEDIVENATETEMIRIFKFLINMENNKENLLSNVKANKEKENLKNIYRNFSCFDSNIETTFVKYYDNEKVHNSFIKAEINKILSYDLRLKNFKKAFNLKDEKMIKETLQFINIEDLSKKNYEKLNEYFRESLSFNSIIELNKNTISVLDNDFFKSEDKEEHRNILKDNININFEFLKDNIKDIVDAEEMKKYINLLLKNEEYIKDTISIPSLYINNTFKREIDDLDFVENLFDEKLNKNFKIKYELEVKELDSFLDEKLIFNNKINPNIKNIISSNKFPNIVIYNNLLKNNKDLLKDEFINSLLENENYEEMNNN